MEVLKGRLKSFETMNEAKMYIEKCKVKWMGPIGFIKDEETGRFDVYIFEYPELMNADLSVREDIFFQSFYFTFPEEFLSDL